MRSVFGGLFLVLVMFVEKKFFPSRFEEDLWKLVDIIKFHRFNCEFQKKLKEDVVQIKLATTSFTEADKTSNMYKMHQDEYKRLLHNSITSNYKKTNKEVAKGKHGR